MAIAKLREIVSSDDPDVEWALGTSNQDFDRLGAQAIRDENY